MAGNFKFSIVTAFYNTEIYIRECIESVINQTLDFKENTQLILVDDGSSDDSKEIALSYQEKYPDNILILSKENGGPSSARNLGLKHAEGEFVNFLDSDDMLEENALSNVLNFFRKNEDISIVAIPIFPLGYEEEYPLQDKFNESKIVNVFDDYRYPHLHMPSTFIKRECLDGFDFDERLNIGEDGLIINKILIDEEKYALLDDTTYYCRKRPDETSILDTIKSKKEFFNDKINYFYRQLIDYSIDKKGFLPDFIKYVIAYDISHYYTIPTSDVLNKEEFLQFRKDLHEILGYIEEDLITGHLFITDIVKTFMVYLKNDEFHIEVKSDNVLIKSNDYIVNSLRDELLFIDVIEIIDGVLNISALFRSSCDYDYLDVEAIKINSDGSKESFMGKFFSYPTTNRYPVESIGVCWKFDYCVDFKIPLKENDTSRIIFNLIYDENGNHAEMHNPIQFQNYDAGLSKVCNYLIKDGQMVIYNGSDESFYLQPYSFVKSAKLEVISILKMIKDHNSSMISGISYHLLFLFMYPIMRNKRIWLFQDRVDVADDNAKHLFRYAVGQDDEVKKYFVIRKDCEDFNEMKKIDANIVPLGSFKNKFLYLFAEKMISSHVNHSWLNPFFNPKHPYFNGLLTIEKCFLQHGVIKDDLSSWLRKFFQNLHLFLTSSDYERDSIMGDTYNYDDEVVKAFGLPRHDYLKFNVAKKEILFAPTWRKYLINRAAFEKSDYYFRLNSFINNERLLKAIENKGYKLVFKPHPDLEQFLDLFNIEDIVEVNTHDSYQTIFNNSAVMITDYSSVFFDFSFLKKPVIYYHEGDDYHYDKGYFDYETMGFGDVIDNEEALVDKIIEYMENDCVMEDKYQKRVDKFFKYTDQKNCKRVYDWLYTH